MSVTSRDREHMRRIGAAKAGSHGEALARHLALTLDERLRRSWDMYLGGRASANLSAREDDPSPFYRRARELGLCDR